MASTAQATIITIQDATASIAGINDKSPISALLARARALMDLGKFDEAKGYIEKALELSPGNSEAMDLLESCNREIERAMRVERDAYNAACAKGNADALRQFISDYPSSQFVADAQLRINDYSLWENARNANTISAYKKYISESKVKAYSMEAELAIKKLEEEQDWLRVKESDNIDELEQHLSKYPNSPGKTEAQWRINWLKGEKYYSQGNMTQAMDYYTKARGTRNLPYNAQKHYEEIVAEQEYQRMLQSTDETDLMAYLSSLSASSSYYNPISNLLAIIKARKLSYSSTESDYRDALSYARDNATAEKVDTYIEKAKKDARSHRRQMRRLAHEMWWERNFKFGWHMVGMEFWEKFSALRSGIRLKLGTHQDIFNIQVGADYVWNAFTDTYKDRNNKDKVSFDPICHQIAVPLNIKFNFTNGDNKCSFYIGVAGEYGYTFSETSDYRRMCNENTLAIEPQIGFNWKHADLGFFWRKYLDGKNLLKKEYEMKDQRAGMYLTVYF